MRAALISGLLFMALLISALGALQAPAQTASASASLDAVNFLVGKWVGEGSQETGQAGSGYCSFEPDLQNKVLVRKNHAEYPAAAGRPAFVHDDLMIIYPDAARKLLRAFYTDSEGHIIHYTVTAASDGKSAVFLGDTQPGAPRFRLTYHVTEPDHIILTFETAPPGKPEQFQKFLEGKLRKTP